MDFGESFGGFPRGGDGLGDWEGGILWSAMDKTLSYLGLREAGLHLAVFMLQADLFLQVHNNSGSQALLATEAQV